MDRDPTEWTAEDVRRWAASDEGDPMQDWDLLVTLHEANDPLLIECVEDDVRPDFFLACLYVLAGDTARGLAGHGSERLEPLLQRAEAGDNPVLTTWAKRSRALLAAPETFAYPAWGWGDLAREPLDDGHPGPRAT